MSPRGPPRTARPLPSPLSAPPLLSVSCLSACTGSCVSTCTDNEGGGRDEGEEAQDEGEGEEGRDEGPGVCVALLPPPHAEPVPPATPQKTGAAVADPPKAANTAAAAPPKAAAATADRPSAAAPPKAATAATASLTTIALPKAATVAAAATARPSAAAPLCPQSDPTSPFEGTAAAAATAAAMSGPFPGSEERQGGDLAPGGGGGGGGSNGSWRMHELVSLGSHSRPSEEGGQELPGGTRTSSFEDHGCYSLPPDPEADRLGQGCYSLTVHERSLDACQEYSLRYRRGYSREEREEEGEEEEEEEKGDEVEGERVQGALRQAALRQAGLNVAAGELGQEASTEDEDQDQEVEQVWGGEG